MNLDLLSILTFLPMLGAGVVMVLPRNQKNLARTVALGFSLAVLILSLYLFAIYSRGTCPIGNVPADMQKAATNAPFAFSCEHVTEFFPLVGSKWHVGVDGLSVVMLLLTGI